MQRSVTPAALGILRAVIPLLSGIDCFRHRFFGPGFAFVGGPYAYYDSCYARVWSAWGWRWVNACY